MVKYEYNILTQGNKVTFLPVSLQDVVYTKHFNISPSNIEDPSFVFEYRAVSDGSVALKIELQQSNNPILSETISVDDSEWCIPDDALEFNNNLDDKILHLKSYPPAPTTWARFKITGLTGNDTTAGLDRLILYVRK